MPKLLLATNNRGKVREYQELLGGTGLELVTPAALGFFETVDETGKTFEENARLKARVLMETSRLLTLADDSGLEVDALGGEPGVRSARYAGENATDARRVEFLLSRLADVPWEKRTARFRCVIAIAQPGGEISVCSGECPGVIALAPAGDNGFGYDPVFYLPGFGKTMAELTPAQKNLVSHRGQAARKAAEILKKLNIS